MRVLQSLLALVAVGYIVVCGFTYFGQEELIFHPRELPDDYVFSFEQPFKELKLTASDGGIVDAAEFPAAKGCTTELGTVIYIHGNAAAIDRFGNRPGYFTSRCWSALLFDYRPFGKSRGELTAGSPLLDARAAYDYVLTKIPSERIILYGQSLGTGIASELASQVKERAVILEAPFLSVLSMAEDQYPYLPVAWFLKFPMRSDLAVPQIKSPVTIFHGTNDDIIPFAQGEALSKLVKSSVKFVAIKGGGHNDLPSAPEYSAALNEILGPPVN